MPGFACPCVTPRTMGRWGGTAIHACSWALLALCWFFFTPKYQAFLQLVCFWVPPPPVKNTCWTFGEKHLLACGFTNGSTVSIFRSPLGALMKMYYPRLCVRFTLRRKRPAVHSVPVCEKLMSLYFLVCLFYLLFLLKTWGHLLRDKAVTVTIQRENIKPLLHSLWSLHLCYFSYTLVSQRQFKFFW